MLSLNRRGFLAASLGGAAVWSSQSLWTPIAHAEDEDRKSDRVQFPTLFLTWRRDPTTTMMIQWVGEENKAYDKIFYAPVDGFVWESASVKTKEFPGTDLKVYRAELTNLTPGTDYRFQIANISPEYRFQTMPAKATDEFRFVSGGDAGTNKEVLKTNELAALQDPYFVFIGGDVAYDNGRAPKTFLKFLENYHATMVDSKGRLIPLVTCLGNHEVDGGYVHNDRSKAGSYLSVFDGLYSEVSYGTLDFGDYLSLVLVDTNHLSPIEGEQTDWLEKTLKERQDHPHVFVAGHIPCYPSARDFEAKVNETMRKLWCPLYERYGVNVVLEHHDHTFKRTYPLLDGMRDPNGIYYLGDGSWGKLRNPGSLEDRPYLAKVNKTYHISLHQLEGDRRIHLALNDEGRVCDLLTTTSKRAAT